MGQSSTKKSPKQQIQKSQLLKQQNQQLKGEKQQKELTFVFPSSNERFHMNSKTPTHFLQVIKGDLEQAKKSNRLNQGQFLTGAGYIEFLLKNQNKKDLLSLIDKNPIQSLSLQAVCIPLNIKCFFQTSLFQGLRKLEIESLNAPTLKKLSLSTYQGQPLKFLKKPQFLSLQQFDIIFDHKLINQSTNISIENIFSRSQIDSLLFLQIHNVNSYFDSQSSNGLQFTSFNHLLKISSKKMGYVYFVGVKHIISKRNVQNAKKRYPQCYFTSQHNLMLENLVLY